jgi:peptidoglycan/LPS O-acetylase OafA/YrhL
MPIQQGMKPTVKFEKLTTSESVALDVIRVCAAMTVVIGHLTQPYFSQGLPNLVLVGRGAVAIFFILSGFVIRYVTVSRRGTMSEFLRDRASRIYSVALPAMLITFVADSISRHLNPAFYSQWEQSNWWKIKAVLQNLTWTAQIWTQYAIPFSNSLFWSLNYEVVYYTVYACAFYLSGTKRWIWVGIVTLIAGPKIMILFPTWLIGCYAHDLCQTWHGSKRANSYLNWACAFIALVILTVLVDHRLARAALGFYKIFYDEGKRLQLQRTSGVLDFYLISLFGAVLLLRLLEVVRYFRVRVDGLFTRSVRYIAEGTFAIYLIHFPLLVLVATCFSYNRRSVWQLVLIFLVVVTIGVLMGQVCKIFKDKLRSIRLPFSERLPETVSR